MLILSILDGYWECKQPKLTTIFSCNWSAKSLILACRFRDGWGWSGKRGNAPAISRRPISASSLFTLCAKSLQPEIKLKYRGVSLNTRVVEAPSRARCALSCTCLQWYATRRREPRKWRRNGFMRPSRDWHLYTI